MDPNENLAKTEWRIREAAAQGAQVICTQELFRSQYFCREENHANFALAEPIPGPSTESLGALAAELGVVIVASLFERRAAGLYHNTAAIIGTDGGLLGMYRKMHIPDDPLYYEKFYFTPGDLGFLNFDTPFGRIGVLDLLGPVVSRSRTACRAGRRERTFLSHCHRLASGGESRVRSRAVGRVEDHSTQPRDRQRRVCSGGESHGIRGASHGQA